MKPRPFDYVRPDTVDEVLALLAEYGDDARILAGGQSLLPMLNLRLIEPAVLIDIARIAELDAIEDRGDGIEIGAAVTQNKLMDWPELAQKLPLVAAALPFVGHFQTRNRGTVCGSIAHADPSSEIPLALAVLGGSVVLRSKRGERVLAADAFQQDMLTTAREPDELIAAVRFPVMEGKGVGFREVARRHGDFAMIAVAAIADSRGSAMLGVGGMAGKPLVRADRRSGRRHRMGGTARRLRGFARIGGDAARSVPQPCSAGDRGGDQKMRRVNKDQRVRVALTLNGRKLSADAEPRLLLSDFLRHVHWRDRHSCRLRARHLRLLHRADRRRRPALLPDACSAGRGQGGAHRGVARRARRHAQSAAAGDAQQSRPAMRLLHAGHLDVVHRFPRRAIRTRPKPRSAKS